MTLFDESSSEEEEEEEISEIQNESKNQKSPEKDSIQIEKEERPIILEKIITVMDLVSDDEEFGAALPPQLLPNTNELQRNSLRGIFDFNFKYFYLDSSSNSDYEELDLSKQRQRQKLKEESQRHKTVKKQKKKHKKEHKKHKVH